MLDPSQPARGVLLPLPRTETQRGFPLWNSCAQGSTVEAVVAGGQHGWTISSKCETNMEAENFVGGATCHPRSAGSSEWAWAHRADDRRVGIRDRRIVCRPALCILD